MVRNRLPVEHLQDQLQIIRRSFREPAFTLALLELSDWIEVEALDADRTALSTLDQIIIAEVLHDLVAMSGILAARLSRTACLYSDDRSVSRDRFRMAGAPRVSTHLWKPESALWTSPLVGEGNSAWSLRAALGSAMKRHPYNLLLARPEPRRAFLLRTLADADTLLADHGGRIELALESLHAEGYFVLDFSWQCVLEAEISALLGERDAVAFPCALGVECSLWLEAPSDPIDVVEMAHPESSSGRETGWFAYE